MTRKKIKENNQPEKSETRKKGKSTSVRIILKIIRILFLWIPLSLILIIIIALIVVKLYLSPGRVENLIISNFNRMSYGSISLKVNSFSPYSGFDIQNIIIRNGEEFNKTKLVEIERLVLNYKLFPMLIGNVHFNEIGIYKPRIFLKEKNGVWNMSRLMKPGAPKEEEIEEEVKEEGPPSKEINLPINVELLLNFTLDDLRLYIDSSGFDSSIEGLTYNMNIWVPPFKRIPLSMDAVALLDTMKLELNPKGEMDVYFSTKEVGLKTPLILTWKLVFDKRDKAKPAFGSVFKFGTYKAPVRFRKAYLAPLNFMVSYDMLFNPVNDHLMINHISISFQGNNLISLSGDIKEATTGQKFNIRMKESTIMLSDLYPYFLSITGDRMTKFSGIISLYPLAVKGDTSNMDIMGSINLKEIYFKNPGAEASIPGMNLSYDVRKRKDDMRISANLGIQRFSANLGRDKLGDNGINMDIDIASFGNFQRVEINKFAFSVFDPITKKAALDLGISGDVNLNPKLSGNIKITRFTFIKDNLSEGIKNKFLSAVPLTKPVDINLGLRFALGKDITKADLGMLVKVPDYDVNDLEIRANIVQDNKEQRISINRFNIGTESLGLKIDTEGFIETAASPFSDSDIKLGVELNLPDMKTIYGPWVMSGVVQVGLNLKGDLKTGNVHGAIKIGDLYIKNDESMLLVEDIDMAFPFEYYFASGPVESRIAVSKSQIIDNENFKEKENFTIRSIKAKHPARNQQFEYVKDFAATMFFKNNAFELSKIKMYVLDGAVYGRDILFYLADMPATGSYKNVEYRLILDVTNVDIGQLDNPDPKAKTREAELSMNTNFSGKGLDMFLGKGKDRGKELNVRGYVNINKIGEKFAKRLFEGLSEEKGKSKIGIAQYAVDNSMDIVGFNYNLNIGLMDVEVNLARKLIGYIVIVEDVKMPRMPIQEYLNNIFGRK